ncbi:ABC transporter substrate-binding protein [Terasakiella sp. SH-1]|uniref:ABC transporter substrate-binding protein n=1 Tax=Terasakiella sp. SH-1 TaxID=2560057 RepID=UPI001073B2C6|nr:ABC transporter substrate-binding protein [Terasakiella sp. SH-1]
MKRLLILLAAILTIGVWGFSVFSDKSLSTKRQVEPYQIALVGPMSGKDQVYGKAMENGARLYINEYNAKRSNEERPLELVVHDDANNAEQAQKIAQQIATDNKTIAVLGHRSSRTTTPASTIYNTHKTPMIAGTATAPAVTKNKDWIFRVVPDNTLQGQFVARYAKSNGHQNISVIYDSDTYGTSLYESFKNSANELGLNAFSSHKLDTEVKNLNEQSKAIVSALAQGPKPDLIFLALHDDEGAIVIRDIKNRGFDWPMIGSASIGKQTFPQLFDGLPQEKKQPGFYTDNLLALSSLIFDVAGEKAQNFTHLYEKHYGIEADSSAAAYYDAAHLIGQALENGAWTEGMNHQQVRENIHAHLHDMKSPSNAMRGITGLISFDDNGNVAKSVHVGMFRDNRLVSATTQLQDIQNPRLVSSLDLSEGRVLEMNDNLFYKTDVIYTGISPINLTNFDPVTLTYEADFYLWFRGGADFDPHNIHFLNAIGDLEIGDAVEKRLNGQIPYQLYRIKGRFQAKAVKGRDAFGEYNLGISFRHQSLPGANLIYVADDIGMGGMQNWRNKIRKERLFDGSTDWAIRDAAVFQDSMRKEAYGNPELLSAVSDLSDYSRFTMMLSVSENRLRLRGIIPPAIQGTALALSILAVLGFMFIAEKNPGIHKEWPVWLSDVLTWMVLLSAGEAVILGWCAERWGHMYLQAISNGFEVAWWLIGGHFIQRAVALFVWAPLEKKTDRPIPRIVRNFGMVIIYALSVLGLLAFVFEQDLTKLLATSGLLAMIIGLALQPNLINIFSGIAISLEKSFKIGDKVKVNNISGEVVDMNWRATKIKTNDKTIISVPNGTMANTTINNLSSSNAVVKGDLTISLDRCFDPHMVMAKVKEIGEAIDGTDKIAISVKTVTTKHIEYAVKIVHATDADKDVVNRIWNEIWQFINELKPPQTESLQTDAA